MNDPSRGSGAAISSPDWLLETWARGHALLREGQFAGACGLFSQVVAGDPLNVAAKIQLALVQLRLGRYRAARQTVIDAAGLNPQAPEHVVPLARLLRNFEESRYLSEIFSDGAWHGWIGADDLFALSRSFATAGLNEEANAVLDATLLIAPGHPHAIYLHAAIAMFRGRATEAQAGFERCLQISPRIAQARWMLSLLGKRVAAPDEVRRIAQDLAHPGLSATDRAYLAYAAHNRLHAMGRFQDAWAMLQSGWVAKRELLTYDRERQERLFDQLMATCSADFMGCVEPARAVASPLRVVFIVGLHRSGTSLLERMLGGHSEVVEGGESYAFPVCLKLGADYPTREVIDEGLVARSTDVDYGELGQRFSDLMRWRAHGVPCITEKLPGNFVNIGYILRALPDAVVLHMVRDPVDTCFSNLRTYFDEAAPYSYDQIDMAHYHGQYQRLMAHWHSVAPGRILDVDYASLVTEPRESIRRVLEHCSLRYEQGVLNVEREGGVVRTATMMDARAGIRTDRHDAWAAYADQLRPLLEALGNAP